MKIVAISDTHGQHRSIRLPKADVLLHAGDVGYRGTKPEVVDFLDWLDKLPHPHKIFIAGNHDFFFEREKKATIDRLLPNSVRYLKDEAVVIDGIKIWGSPYTPRFFQWAFNKARGHALADQWKNIPEDTDVLLTHGPVYGILDLTADEQHAGDKELLTRILEIKPKFHVCGHIHEAYGVLKRRGITFVNACLLNENNVLVNKPVLFSI